MIGPASRPARALRLAGVIAVAALAVRAPTMRARFDAAVRAAGPVVQFMIVEMLPTLVRTHD